MNTEPQKYTKVFLKNTSVDEDINEWLDQGPEARLDSLIVADDMIIIIYHSVEEDTKDPKRERGNL